MDAADLRLRLALPFTIVTEPDTVRLIAGEDLRYTLQAPDIENWLPPLLEQLDGSRTVKELVDLLDPAMRETASAVLDRLVGERVAVKGTAADAHQAAKYKLVVTGSGPVADGLRNDNSDDSLDPLHVLCQDRLDYHEALEFNQERLRGNHPWIWITTGPMARGYVSPVFLPDAGPCLSCLLRQFQRISPAPELYDALIDHSRAGKPVEASPFPDQAAEMLLQIVQWKQAHLADEMPPAALYRLHVVDASDLNITTHRVFNEPDCPHCGPADHGHE
jgi:bacteriocin biosynthesis cyclodehydratase domain-containing protein